MMNKINKSGKKTVSKIMLMATILGALTLPINAQPPRNVGIGTENPNPSALLDLDVTNLSTTSKKGLLIPRVALTGISDQTTIPAATVSLLVYNTDSAGIAPNNVVPGFYYWNGSAWVRLVTTSSPGAVPFSYIQSDTNKTAQMTVGTGASLLLAGTGIVEASRIKGDGSATDAVDLATNETAGVLPIAKGGTGLGTVPANNKILVGNGTDYIFSEIIGTANQVTVANGAGTITLGLPNTAVTANTYGSATQVPQFTVDAQGRLTNAGNVTIAGTSPVGSSLTSGKIWVGNGSDLAAEVSLNSSVRTAISATAPILYDNSTGIVSISPNSLSTDGFVASGESQNSKVWKTDALGNPAWRNDSITVYTAGTGLLLSAANEFSARNDTAMWNAKKIVGKNIVDTLQPTAGQTIVWNETNNQWQYGNTITRTPVVATNGIAYFSDANTLTSTSAIVTNGFVVGLAMNATDLRPISEKIRLEVRDGDILGRRNVVLRRVQTSDSTAELHFYEAAGGEDYIAFKAPTDIAGVIKYILPSAPPVAGQVLSSSTIVGSEVPLTWVSASMPTGTSAGQTIRYNGAVWVTSDILQLFTPITPDTVNALLTGDMKITGDLIVDGNIDPTSIILQPQTTAPYNARQGMVYYDANTNQLKVNSAVTGATPEWGTVAVSNATSGLSLGSLAISGGSLSLGTPNDQGAVEDVDVTDKTYIKVSHTSVKLGAGKAGQIIILQKTGVGTTILATSNCILTGGIWSIGAANQNSTITLIYDLEQNRWIEIARSLN